MRRWPIALCVGVLITAAAAQAKQGRVVTHDGQTYEGEVEQADGRISITDRGITVSIDPGTVASLKLYDSPEQEFASRLKGMPDGDAKARMDLARWAFDRKLYPQARDAAEAAVAVDPNFAEAVEFQNVINRQVQLERKTAAKATQASDADAADAGADQTPKALATVPASQSAATTTDSAVATPPAAGISFLKRRPGTLTPEQVNRIRQVEWQPGDASVRVRLPDDLRRQYALDRGYDPIRFNSRPILDQAYEIIHEGTPAQAARVQLLNDPYSISYFRRQVQPALLAGCASAGCHGQAAAGGYGLLIPADNDTAALANFAELQSTTAETRDGLRRPMVDRMDPEKSLLLHFGVSRGESDTPHPNVPGFKPIYKSARDPNFRAALTWLGQILSPVQPDYRPDPAGPAADGITTFVAPGLSDPPVADAPPDASVDAPSPLSPFGEPAQKPDSRQVPDTGFPNAITPGASTPNPAAHGRAALPAANPPSDAPGPPESMESGGPNSDADAPDPTNADSPTIGDTPPPPRVPTERDRLLAGQSPAEQPPAAPAAGLGIIELDDDGNPLPPISPKPVRP